MNIISTYELSSLEGCGVDNCGGVVGQPGVDPGQGEHNKGRVAQLLVVCITRQLGQLCTAHSLRCTVFPQ